MVNTLASIKLSTSQRRTNSGKSYKPWNPFLFFTTGIKRVKTRLAETWSRTKRRLPNGICGRRSTWKLAAGATGWREAGRGRDQARNVEKGRKSFLSWKVNSRRKDREKPTEEDRRRRRRRGRTRENREKKKVRFSRERNRERGRE